MTSNAPEQLPFDENMINKINDFINKANKQNSLSCDSKCRKDKETAKLYQKYISAKKNLTSAPNNLEEAEKNYFVASKGAAWFSNKQESDARKMANKDITEIQENLDGVFNEMELLINVSNNQNNYKNKVGDLERLYSEKIANSESQFIKEDNKKNISERMSEYYNNESMWSDTFFFYVKKIYWVLVAVVFIYTLWNIFKQKYIGNQIYGAILTNVIFVATPYFLDNITQLF